MKEFWRMGKEEVLKELGVSQQGLAGKDAGITKHISYHCSRHSFACLQLDAGTSIAVVQRYLGHKNVATTEVYAKISDVQKLFL